MRSEALKKLAEKVRREGKAQKTVKSAQALEAAANLERFRRFLAR